MGEDGEFNDEPLTDNAELDEFEKHLIAAIRESYNLDAEIDDEYRRLVNDEYDEPSVQEPGVSDGDDPQPRAPDCSARLSRLFEPSDG